jgi:hypothetical protein
VIPHRSYSFLNKERWLYETSFQRNEITGKQFFAALSSLNTLISYGKVVVLDLAVTINCTYYSAAAFVFNLFLLVAISREIAFELSYSLQEEEYFYTVREILL